MKMLYHIDDFKCTLCTNWFCPPFNLPYLLPCTHSICTSCLQKSSTNDHIICPQDLEACPIQAININVSTKKALERLMKEHKSYSENTQLECIKALSIGFDEILGGRERELRNLQGLIQQIFSSEIQRLRQLWEKLKIEINRPYRVVEDWKQIVATHLTQIRKTHTSTSTSTPSTTNPDSRANSMLQLNHYIEQGRKIKMQLNQFFQLEFDLFADRVMRNPRACFQKDFGINLETLEGRLKGRTGESALKMGGTATDKKLKEKCPVISQTRSKLQSYDPIETSTIVLSSQNRRTSNQTQIQSQASKEISRPLSNIDMNRGYASQVEIESGGVETKRGNVKEAKGQGQGQGLYQNQNGQLGRYILGDNEKNNSKNAPRKQSQNKAKKSQARVVSPFKARLTDLQPQPKNMKQESRLSSRLDCRNSFNQPSQQSKHQQFSLSQFQLETVQNENQPLSVPQRLQPKPRQPQKSPSQLSKYSSTEQDRLNRLAHMLQNISNPNSSRNSLKKSLKSKTQKGLQQTSGDNSLLMSPNTICQRYTEEAEAEELGYQEEQLLNNQEMLMNQDREDGQGQGQGQGQGENGWQMGNINFLRQWKLKNQNSLEQPLQIRQNTYYYNCQKQKLSYMRKMQIHRVQEALKLTLIKDNFIELINESLHDVDMSLYLQQFDWKHSNIEIVKFVKTSMNDEQLNILLNFLLKGRVKALVLSGNNLTDICLDALLNFVSLNSELKNVYLPKNYINILKSKAKINLLKERGVNIYV